MVVGRGEVVGRGDRERQIRSDVPDRPSDGITPRPISVGAYDRQATTAAALMLAGGLAAYLVALAGIR